MKDMDIDQIENILEEVKQLPDPFAKAITKNKTQNDYTPTKSWEQPLEELVPYEPEPVVEPSAPKQVDIQVPKYTGASSADFLFETYKNQKQLAQSAFHSMDLDGVHPNHPLDITYTPKYGYLQGQGNGAPNQKCLLYLDAHTFQYINKFTRIPTFESIQYRIRSIENALPYQDQPDFYAWGSNKRRPQRDILALACAAMYWYYDECSEQRKHQQ